jgi:hypothetical protein
MTTPVPEPEPLEAPGDNRVVGWAKALVFGIRDTAKDMLDEGRRGADEAYEQGWRRFDSKTKTRRQHKK